MLTGANPHVTQQAVQSSKTTVITCFSFVFNGPGFRLRYLFILLMSKHSFLSLPAFPNLSPDLPRPRQAAQWSNFQKSYKSSRNLKSPNFIFQLARTNRGRVGVMNVDLLYGLHLECAVCSLHWNSSLTKESLLTCSACAGLPHRALAFAALLNCTLAHCVLRSGCIPDFITPKKLHIMYIDNEEACPCSFSLFNLSFLVSSSLLACCRPW